MAEMTLELIAQVNETYGEGRSISLEIVNHVHHRVETFRFLDQIKPVAVPLDYIETGSLDSWRDLQIANRTYGVPANADKNAEVRKNWITTTSTSLSSQYKTIVATNEVGPDVHGATRPLFYKHILPVGTVECYLEKYERGNNQRLDGGYRLDLGAGLIYTNFENFFDQISGSYVMFYVTCTTADGLVEHQLLNPVPVANEATWEDIDLATGRLRSDLVTYTRARNADGYTFSMSKGDTWYWRPVEKSLIQPRRPTGRLSTDSWYLSFSAGDIADLTNGQVRRYWVPEYDQQNFVPSKPYVYSPYEEMLWVNSRTVAATRKNLAIDPDANRHITLFIKDYEGTLVRILTTNSSLHQTRYGDTDVFYEADQVRSWDNAGGFISLSAKLYPGYQIAAQYHWEADDYEYRLLNLNPVENPGIVGKMVVFYAVPEADPDDRGIHHLVVGQDGVILECSQNQGFSYPNLQLFDEDGTTVNTATVVGKKYVSDVERDTFMRNFTVGYDNVYAYTILAEVVLLDGADEDDAYVYDVRRPGLRLSADSQDEALLANPRILQSQTFYGENGQEVPKNKVVVIDADLELLEDYGGVLSKTYAEQLLKRHLDASCYGVVDWKYPAPEVTARSLTSEVVLSWTWEGPGLTYKLYKSSGLRSEWTLIHQVDGGASPTSMSYTDEAVNAEDVTYYTVRCEKTNAKGETVLFPRTHLVSVKVAE